MEVRAALNSLQFAELDIDGKQIFIKTQSSDLASKILQLLKIKSPRNVTPTSEIKF